MGKVTLAPSDKIRLSHSGRTTHEIKRTPITCFYPQHMHTTISILHSSHITNVCYTINFSYKHLVTRNFKKIPFNPIFNKIFINVLLCGKLVNRYAIEALFPPYTRSTPFGICNSSWLLPSKSHMDPDRQSN